ncbi:MAG: 3-phosphoshikimate 1-carboxyvinyltransferase [Clostridia bacterium]|nr:3-phosphoshikimate 1-carboxyvinyltransferase [Clostridia bacterium]
MNVTVFPGIPHGTVCLPPSKSIAHRVLVCAAITEGTTRIYGAGTSSDVTATVNCLRGMGADIIRENDGSYTVHGGLSASGAEGEKRILDCGESASTLRFLLPLCLCDGIGTEIKCSGRLPQRPMGPYEELCRRVGAEFRRERSGYYVRGRLNVTDMEIDPSKGSQFVTGLMFAVGYLKKEGEIRLTGLAVSRGYILMTAKIMEIFGYRVTVTEGKVTVSRTGKSTPSTVTVGGDMSAAAVFGAFGSAVRGADVRILGGEYDVLAEYGDGESVCLCGVQDDGRYGEYMSGDGPVRISLRDVPDLGPILMAAAAVSGRGGEFSHAERLQGKESDRLYAMKEELSAFGVDMTVSEDDDGSLTAKVSGGIHTPVRILQGHKDHRIVMALSLICAVTGGSITDAECVGKSYPVFWEDLASLGISTDFKAIPHNSGGADAQSRRQT